MRLPDETALRAFALLGLSAALGACALIPRGGDRLASADPAPIAAADRSGPMADFPQVLGDPFTVDGQEFVPADTASYDAVGYATLDGEGGQGVTVAHKTLPMPSYVEITSLETGRAILARVERRGPMTASRLVGLSQAAQVQLGSPDGTPVRVRRVNPPEVERAELRAGRAVSERMDTPKSLLAVLRRKLESDGAVPLQLATTPTKQEAEPTHTAAAVTELPPVAAARPGPVAQSGAERSAATSEFEKAFEEQRNASSRYPLKPISSTPVAAPKPPVARDAEVASTRQADVPARPATHSDAAQGEFVIQAAAFANKANAEKAAGSIGGFVSKAGRYYRVRTGPYTTRGQAEAALAKVRAAGYSDARVFTAG